MRSFGDLVIKSIELSEEENWEKPSNESKKKKDWEKSTAHSKSGAESDSDETVMIQAEEM